MSAHAPAKFVVNCYARRVLTKPRQAPTNAGANAGKSAAETSEADAEAAAAGRSAAGVECEVLGKDGKTRHKLIVRCPVVVVSCGSLQTPLLLTRSGLTNKWVRTHGTCMCMCM